MFEMMNKAGTLLVALLLSSSLFLPALGQEEGGVVSKLETNLLMPVADALSGSVWLRLKGLDPAHVAGGYRESASVALQAPGGGAVVIPYRSPSPKFSRNKILFNYSVFLV